MCELRDCKLLASVPTRLSSHFLHPLLSCTPLALGTTRGGDRAACSLLHDARAIGPRGPGPAAHRGVCTLPHDARRLELEGPRRAGGNLLGATSRATGVQALAEACAALELCWRLRICPVVYLTVFHADARPDPSHSLPRFRFPQGALQSFIGGCLHDDPVVVKLSVTSLLNLTSDYELQPALVARGAVAALCTAVARSRRWQPPHHLSQPLRVEASRLLLLLSMGDDLKEALLGDPWGDWDGERTDLGRFPRG